MGIIEDRLAELEAKKPPRMQHKWRLERKGHLGVVYNTGDYECALCGGWMSGLHDPNLYVEGCPGVTG